jgi:glycosyltransferase involved in cell wall biosynthesis
VIEVSQTDPLVSVVITCFDTDPEQLAEAIASVRAQTYPHVEVVVVDDGSSLAATLQLLDSVSHEGVRVLHQENRGVSAARNRGMAAARGAFLLPLDGDDVLDPGYLAATVPVLRDQPAVAIVSTQAEYFGGRAGLMDLPDPSLPWMVAENSIHNTSLFRRADFERLGGYDEALRTGFEDHEWWVRLLLDGGTATVLDEVLFRYRIQPSSRNAVASSSEESLRQLRAAMTRNNPAHGSALTSMAFTTLDTALARMHAAEARVAHLEHHLGPVVRTFDRHPALGRALNGLRRAKSSLRRRAS